MGPPVRTVCAACLRSLEIASFEEVSGRATCPYCGYVIGRERATPGASTGENDASPTLHDPEAPTPRVDAQAKFPPGRIGRFVIREPLGEGGYGHVFRAYDPQLDRDVALKVLKPNWLGEKAMERFYREARAAARLDHPHIVGLHDAGREDGRCWIAYQLVTGRTLALIRDQERLPVDDSVRIIRDLALALDHAHSRGVFHRDLKPANVLVEDSGRARLTDFGLARREDVDSDLTREGTVLGTPQYMSPEAAAGRAHEADARSDVYSLGVILYELICGRRPGDLPSDAPLWRASRVVTPPTPRSVDRAVPVDLDRICMKALAFRPEDRHPTARALADSLTRHLQARHARQEGRRRVGAGGLTLGLTIAAAIVGLVLGIGYHATGRTGPVTIIPTALVSRLDLKPSLPPDAVEPDAPASSTTRVAMKPAPPPVDVMAEPSVRSRASKSPTFHLKSGCQHTRGKDESKLVDLGTVRDALSQHLQPCRDCLAILHRSGEAAPTSP